MYTQVVLVKFPALTFGDKEDSPASVCSTEVRRWHGVGVVTSRRGPLAPKTPPMFAEKGPERTDIESISHLARARAGYITKSCKVWSAVRCQGAGS